MLRIVPEPTLRVNLEMGKSGRLGHNSGDIGSSRTRNP